MKSQKIFREHIISHKGMTKVPGEGLSKKDKANITAAVKKIVKEYGDVLKMLGN